jgi:hypothetical protein
LNSISLRSELDNLDAMIAAEVGGIDLALEKLSGSNDPAAIRSRLSLLIQGKRIADAYNEISVRAPEAEWLELGIRVSVLHGDISQAKAMVNAGQVTKDSTGTLHQRACTAFADANLSMHVGKSVAAARSIYATTNEFRVAASEALALLQPYAAKIISDGRVHTPLDIETVAICVLLLGLTGRKRDTFDYLSYLSSRNDIHPFVARLVVEGRLPLVEGISNAIRESPSADPFESPFASTLIAHEQRPDLQRHFGDLLALIPRAMDEGQKGLLFSALSDLATQGGAPYIKEIHKLESSLLTAAIPDHRARRAIFALSNKSIDDAELFLGSENADPFWLHAKARVSAAREDNEEAAEYLTTAALSILHDQWLGDAATSNIKHKKLDRAAECLKALRDFYPWESGARLTLARVLWELGNHDDSLVDYEGVLGQVEDQSSLKLEVASRYLDVDRGRDALAILDGFDVSSVLPALLLRARALQRLDRADEAFEQMCGYIDNYKTSPQFLVALMNLGYVVGQDDKAHSVLEMLIDLRRKGEIDSKIMWEASLDDIIELSKASAERTKAIADQIVHGRLPWTVGSEASRSPTLFDWGSRTQPLRWVSEDPESRGMLSIYATNGFTVAHSSDSRRLVEIAASNTDSICLDYSALITLHQLKLLPLLSDVYQTVFIPSEYRRRVSWDVGRLRPHQLSRKSGHAAIQAAIIGKRIVVLDAIEDDICLVDEYTEHEQSSASTLATLRAALLNAGALKIETSKKLAAVSHKPVSASKLQIGSRIRISLSTLLTICTVDALDETLAAFKVHIGDADRVEVSNVLASYARQEELLVNLTSMWDEISKHPNIRFVSKPGGSIEDSPDTGGEWALAAIQLADAIGTSLLVDDRALQAILLNRRGVSDAAFGTDVFLGRLRDDQRITDLEHATATLQLMRWRYRFITPDVRMLKTIAAQYAGAAPGTDIVDITRYIQDCMSDPGLFGGLEQSEPPTSMALKLYMTWTATLGEFLADVWLDDTFSDERSEGLTLWTAHAMLPQIPNTIPQELQSRLAQVLKDTPIVNALLGAIGHAPGDRMARQLELLRSELGVPKWRFDSLVAQIASYVPNV